MGRRSALEADLRDSLREDPPTVAPRWFYDERGSRLFDEITRLPEYYPTREETAIPTGCAAELLALAEPRTILELGSGTSTKARRLLENWHAEEREFVPVDVSEENTHESAEELARLFPGLRVTPVIADFHHLSETLPGTPGRRLPLFLGGTVGNFTEGQRARFLRVLSRLSARSVQQHHFNDALAAADPDVTDGVRVIWQSPGRAQRDVTAFQHVLKTAGKLHRAGRKMIDDVIIDAYRQAYEVVQSVGAYGRSREEPPMKDLRSLARRVRGYVSSNKRLSHATPKENPTAGTSMRSSERKALATLGRRDAATSNA